MTTTTRAPRVETTAPKGRDARAAMLLAIYLGLGADRTIERARQIASSVGVTVSPNTAARYSIDFHFVERAAEHDGERMKAVQKVALQDAIVTDQEQQNLARLLTSYGENVIKSHLFDDKGAVKPDLSAESVTDAIRAAAEGFKMTRLVNGQATEIHGAITSWYFLVANTIARIWQEAMNEAAKSLRAKGVPEEDIERAVNAAKAYYVPNADRAVTEHYRALGMDVALIGGGAPPAARIVEERE